MVVPRAVGTAGYSAEMMVEMLEFE